MRSSNYHTIRNADKMKKDTPDKNIAEDYVKNNIQINDLCKKYKLCRQTICNILQKNTSYTPKKRKIFDYSIMTKEILHDLYIIKKMSSREMMSYFGITNHKIMRKIMIKHGIPTNNKRRSSIYSISYEEIEPNYWSSIGRGAKKRGYEFSITIEYAWDLFIKQGRKCAISGIPIEFCKYSYKKNTKKKLWNDSRQTASLDRIDSSKGYIEGNIQWLHKNINIMKKDHIQSDFIKICKTIATNNP